ncbi:hypothetical protein [Kitasatospora sp. NPDC057015]|uniref:hypothetical protein n=1 Tax=Kitasatospora sp. NPDC057015 TaxID=3346001 RepID=UPI0036376647
MSMWWMVRRDDLLAELAGTLVFFGAHPMEDPGIGELAHTAATLAGEYRAGELGEDIRRAGRLLQEAAVELHAADRFRGTLLPVVNRHLHHATTALTRARTCLQSVPRPTSEQYSPRRDESAQASPLAPCPGPPKP